MVSFCGVWFNSADYVHVVCNERLFAVCWFDLILLFGVLDWLICLLWVFVAVCFTWLFDVLGLVIVARLILCLIDLVVVCYGICV